MKKFRHHNKMVTFGLCHGPEAYVPLEISAVMIQEALQQKLQLSDQGSALIAPTKFNNEGFFHEARPISRVQPKRSAVLKLAIL